MSPKPEAEVHWFEGMFLRPHHLQAFASQIRSALADSSLGLGPFRYGIQRLVLDETNLQAGQLVVHDADLTMPDGIRISVPANARVESRQFGEAFEQSRGRLEVHWGVPNVPAGVGAVADAQNLRARYQVDELHVPDENTGRSEQTIELRWYNARLFLGGEDTSGYSTMKIAEIVRTSNLDPEPKLDPVYVPPLLDVTAHVGLHRRLGEICDELRATNADLGRKLSSQEISMSIQTGQDPSSLFKLHTTNAQVPIVEQTCLSAGVHPFDAYRALCGLAGSLSMFSPDMRSCPSFPLYDHEDIGGRFDQVIRIIKGHLHSTVKRTWDRLTFERAADSPYRYDCKLKDDWVDGTYALYLGVESELAATEIEQRMMSQMKIAAPNDISNILGAVVRGVTLAPQSRVPAALPEHAHTHYYLLDAERTDDLRWRPVRESRAICLVGDPKDANIQFHIYAAKRG